MRWTLPNILTVGRLLAAPSFALVFVILPSPAADWAALALFLFAAATDFLDGYLARRWNQISAFGRMLDPIADKAMVVIALAVILGLSGLNPWVLIPAAVILFREVFVSGLREFLGADAGRLKVTRLAKWKTTLQMVAIPALLVTGIWQFEYLSIYHQLGAQAEREVLAGRAPDEFGLRATAAWFQGVQFLALGLLWLSAALTVVTGADYFFKSLPYLKNGGK